MVENFEQLKLIADSIATQFGKSTEVVIHDFTVDLEHTIVYIVNEHVTGRKIGGCATNIFYQKFNSKKSADNGKERYITKTKDGKTLRSSTTDFKDKNGNTVASLCINQDITALVQLNHSINSMNDIGYFDSNILNPNNELHSASINDLLESIISNTLDQLGVPVQNMNKKTKMAFIESLYKKGIFTIQKSSIKICELLGISKFTLYNYLDEIKKNEKK
jgi:predicted transcriptional regulator YheO